MLAKREDCGLVWCRQGRELLLIRKFRDGGEGDTKPLPGFGNGWWFGVCNGGLVGRGGGVGDGVGDGV